jgi:hypothetical protein
MGETMDPRRLNSDDVADREPCSITTAPAVSLASIGAVAQAILAYGGLAL